MKQFILIISLFFCLSSFAETNITGEWTGTRYQYDFAKTKYIAEFEYKYILTQEGNQVKGISFIQSKSGNTAEIAVRGFVEGNQFYFEEYEIIAATRPDGFGWCLKKGVLDLAHDENGTKLTGKTPSFMEIYGIECTGGYTDLTKAKKVVNPEEIVLTETELEKTLNLNVYPNPFVSSTQMSFHIDKAQEVKIEVVNIQGKELASNSQFYEAGDHIYTFTPDLKDNSNYYYIRIKIGDKVLSKAVQKSNYEVLLGR